MSSPGWNPHKKGEHVFNDIAGSLDNAFTSALKADSIKFVTLVNRHSIDCFGSKPKNELGISVKRWRRG